MTDEWRLQAACKGKPTRWWFPEQGDTTEAGRAVCAVCPVQTECGDYAATAEETTGMWAGVLLDVRRPKTGQRVRVKERVLAELKASQRSWTTVSQIALLTGINRDSVSRALREIGEEHALDHENGGYWRLSA